MAVLPELLEKNLKTLERSQPKLAARLRETAQGLERFPEPVISETSAGRWISGLTERPFFEPSLEETSRPKLAKGAVYLVHGAGCPPYLFHILRALPRDALAVIVIEPSVPVLLHALASTSVFMALPKGCRISFIVYEDRPLIDEAFEHNVIPLGIFPLSDAVPIIHKGLEEIRTEIARAVNKRFREEVIYRLTLLGNSPEDTLLGIRHGALNTLRILRSPSFNRLMKQFGGKPFVSVASGPSLEKNIDLLKGIEDKCVIVACDTVLLPLLRRGIRPHVVTTIERTLGTYEAWAVPVLEEYAGECRSILLISQSVSHPLIAGRWPGPNIVVGKRESPADTWLVSDVLGKTLLVSGMSVAHMNLSLAIAMKASALAFLGQDLAYADDQRTHVSGAVPAAIAALDEAMERIEVPGSLGGVVQTHRYWLNFLQIFERLISAFGNGLRISDCTEGGALIRGTEVIPFRSFIEDEISPRTNFQWEPAKIIGEYSDDEEHGQLESRIERAFKALVHCDALLERMEAAVAVATAPALSPAKRQEAAFQVADLLDSCHSAHPVLSFIGQSYTHLAGASLARNRFMETVEQVHEWWTLHDDIIRSHRRNVAFLRQWLQYIQGLASGAILENPEDKETGVCSVHSELVRFFGGGEPDLFSDTAFSISETLCRCDLALEADCDSSTSWNAARFFFVQGRATEARRIMKRIYERMEGSERSASFIGSFFLDWARIEGTSDLCEPAHFERALELARNAASFDDSLKLLSLRLQENFLAGQRAFFARYGALSETYKATARLLELRNKAAEALSQEQLPEAFQWIRKFIDFGLETHPAYCLPNVRWLLDTALKCKDAEDPSVSEASRDALDALWEKRKTLEYAGFLWPETMMEYLREKGLKVSVEATDTPKEM